MCSPFNNAAVFKVVVNSVDVENIFNKIKNVVKKRAEDSAAVDPFKDTVDKPGHNSCKNRA